MYQWFATTLVYYGLSLGAGNLGGDLLVNNLLNGLVEFICYVFLPAFIDIRCIGRKYGIIITMAIGRDRFLNFYFIHSRCYWLLCICSLWRICRSGNRRRRNWYNGAVLNDICHRWKVWCIWYLWCHLCSRIRIISNTSSVNWSRYRIRNGSCGRHSSTTGGEFGRFPSNDNLWQFGSITGKSGQNFPEFLMRNLGYFNILDAWDPWHSNDGNTRTGWSILCR